jgi:hypothetical protein
MNLEDVYTKCVPKETIHLPSLSHGRHSPTIIRDPEANAFERGVFERLRSVIPVEEQTKLDTKTNNVDVVSFEDALRELAAII